MDGLTLDILRKMDSLKNKQQANSEGKTNFCSLKGKIYFNNDSINITDGVDWYTKVFQLLLNNTDLDGAFDSVEALIKSLNEKNKIKILEKKPPLDEKYERLEWKRDKSFYVYKKANIKNGGIGEKVKDLLDYFSTYTDLSKYKIEIDENENNMNGGNSKMEAQNNSLMSEIEDLIKVGKVYQIIFTGAPGTGKTYIAREIAESITPGVTPELVQFHPSYDYTDFVEGLRPIEVQTENKTAVTFKKVDGIFKAFCRKVVEQGDSSTLKFFIIDEINRATLSKVFGELMYGLEKDKRGEKNGIKTQYANLSTYDIERGETLKDEEDVFKNGFYIPENVVIIGTMNDIDRSVDSMDFALRRRFDWKEFKVTQDSLEGAFKTMLFSTEDKAADKKAYELAEIVHNFNEEYIHNLDNIYGLNTHYDISQGQFANLPENLLDKEVKEILEYVWKYRVESLLSEYLRGEDDIEKYLDKCRNAFIPYSDKQNAASSEE